MLVSTASLICARNLSLGNVRLLCTSSIPPIPRGMLNLKQVTYILNISTTNSYSTCSINVPTFKKIHTFIAKLEMFYRQTWYYYTIKGHRNIKRRGYWSPPNIPSIKVQKQNSIFQTTLLKNITSCQILVIFKAQVHKWTLVTFLKIHNKVIFQLKT